MSANDLVDLTVKVLGTDREGSLMAARKRP